MTKNWTVKDFYYDLPRELIAQTPLQDRAASRLLVLNRKTKALSHHTFRDVVSFCSPGDLLVLNNTRVIPARLIGTKTHTGAKIEFLLLKRLDFSRWEVILKPGKRAMPGTEVDFGEGLLTAKVLEQGEDGTRIVSFSWEGVFEEILDRLGQMPLPPYIQETLSDRERYQTVYAKLEGSAAAPTAGLHFTKELLQAFREQGVEIAFVTLHVGLGTFRPVKIHEISHHKMHKEHFILTEEAANKINNTRKQGGRVIAVGTTTVRVLESAADENGMVQPMEGDTDIFIYPGYQFQAVDRLITNFHLPESTLMMLISAFAGKDFVMEAYEEAIRERYRFFSFGDACFII